MSNTVNVDFVTKVIEIEVNDTKEETLAAQAAINSAAVAKTKADEAAKSAAEAENNKEVVQTLHDAILGGYGYPLTAMTADAMTDTDKIYVYVGSEDGYTNGNWYYYDGNDWTSGGVYNAVAFDTDKTLSISDEAADAKSTGDAIDKINTEFNDKIGSHYTWVYPSNWYNPATVSSGIMGVDGTVTEDPTRVYTDYIPVKENDVVATYRNGNYNRIYSRKITAFDSSKTAIPAKGRNNGSTLDFTIQSGVAYVRITIDNPTVIKPIIVTDGVAPTTYTEYFDPYQVLTEDFLTPASQNAVDKLVNKETTTADLKNRYASAFPKNVFRQTVGLPQTWYNINGVTPQTEYAYAGIGSEYQQRNNYSVTFTNEVELDSANGYTWYHYDMLLNPIDYYLGDFGYGGKRKIIEENLSSCSLLAIGDSTVDQDTFTAKMLEYFTQKGFTLTLLGTLGDGTAANHNEGRAGWKASDYLTDRQYHEVVNPFYNPSLQTFDFSYYMTNQGYTSPDFVIIQLGINDLSGHYADEDIENTWNAIQTMIDSIRTYDSDIKIILNLPTPVTTDQSIASNSIFLTQNVRIRYNEYAMAKAKTLYGDSQVRCSYCHLILDPNTDLRDNTHPTAEGYTKMAMEVINQINCWQNE